uniref:Uncharacterized protein n=1 Tax=Oryzias latipes TaxID=8090 RepID=A0A3P9LBF3_ORYLA
KKDLFWLFLFPIEWGEGRGRRVAPSSDLPTSPASSFYRSVRHPGISFSNYNFSHFFYRNVWILQIKLSALNHLRLVPRQLTSFFKQFLIFFYYHFPVKHGERGIMICCFFRHYY